jgi:hypothetical protein
MTWITFILVFIILLFFMLSLVLKKLIKGNDLNAPSCGMEREGPTGQVCSSCGRIDQGRCTLKEK